MAFYDLSKEERVNAVEKISNHILKGLQKNDLEDLENYFSDEDTYIRKAAWLSLSRIYFKSQVLQVKILKALRILMQRDNFKIRQSAINAAGEIGKRDFEPVQAFFDEGLFDPHHSPRNAIIGSIKKISEVNPEPVLLWAKKYLHHPDKEIRREICHGIELRGRKHPEDILPLLKELQFDQTLRVRNTLVHVIGQIAYKKDCLKTVIGHLNHWDNKTLIKDAAEEIIDVHRRYKNFAAISEEEAQHYISAHLLL